jgi:hypothetical protein
MKDFKKQIYILAGIACFGIAGTASATVIGQAGLANCTLGGVFVDANDITWSGPGTAPNTGCFAVGGGSTLSYSGGAIPGGGSNFGNIKDLVFSPATSGDQFLQFLSAPSLDFILTGFAPVTPTDGTNCAALAAGHSCVAVSGSPFLLTNIGGGQTLIGLTGVGTVTDGTLNTWRLVFSTQLAQSAGSIQAATAPGGAGIGPTTWSGTLTLAPEPGTLAMFVLAGVGLIGIGRKKHGNR